MSQVVNIKVQELIKHGYENFHEWNSLPENVYICRANRFLKVSASKYANPFLFKDHDRKTALKLYEDYLRKSPWLIKSIKELDKKNLGCFCFPLPCHGDIIIKILNELVSKTFFQTLFTVSFIIKLFMGKNLSLKPRKYPCILE